LAAIVAAGATSGGGIWALTRIARKGDLMTRSQEVNDKVGTRKEWLAARLKLLQAEKEHTRRGDELALQRQALP
jgi:hypothetical protein